MMPFLSLRKVQHRLNLPVLFQPSPPWLDFGTAALAIWLHYNIIVSPAFLDGPKIVRAVSHLAIPH